jgi:cytochrome b involved in lipid metabolism
VIKWEEVQKHMEEDDIWLVIHGKVYDVSKFTTHPGGYELLVDASGYDATAPFEDNDHSVTAKETLV